MKDRDYTHAVQIDTGKCVGCSHCMQVCPTQAIRIAEGHAGIIPEQSKIACFQKWWFVT